MRADYLDYLAEYLHCGYLSDLRRIRVTPRQAQELGDIPTTDFSEQAYREAVFYILGQSMDTADSATIKNTLLERMQNR